MSILSHTRPHSTRPTRPLDHRWSREVFIRRVRAEAAAALASGEQAVAEYAGRAIVYVADTQTLITAAEYIRAKGETAPGVDGVRPRDLGRGEVYDLARRLSAEVEAGRYRPSKERKFNIPKNDKGDTRPLSIPTFADRVVQRAVVEIVQPLLDPLFSPNTFGARPGRSTAGALARALALSRARGRWWWVVADVRKAFDEVIHDRLMAVVAQALGGTGITSLIETIVRTNRSGIGIAQGGPLSPLLMNLLLHAELDLPWWRAHPDLTLVRWVDDLLLLCTDADEAAAALAELRERLASAGLAVKETPAPQVADLGAGGYVEWLGLRVSAQDGRPHMDVAKRGWTRHARRLRDAHHDDYPTATADRVVSGWVQHAGITRRPFGPVCDRIEHTAAAYDLGEAVNRTRLARLWAAAGDRLTEAYALECRDAGVEE